MIRIDAIRALRRDLHMRPFEADRRVYLVLSAHLMNDDAADALLKDLEEPPPYAVIVLVADDLGPISATIRSRCQPVPFRRLSERAVREAVDTRAPELDEARRVALARVAAGRLDRLERLLDPHAVSRREVLLREARAAYREPAFEPSAAAAALLECAKERGAEAKGVEEANVAGLELPAREAEQRVRRAQHGAEREELLAQLEELEAWYRDLVVVGVGADAAAAHVDRIDELRADATRERLLGAERAAEAVRESWRRLEEFNLAPQLALEALFVEVAAELRA
jgi:DNA polymerase-3 subunit delta'